mgnify:CR=1 FL=1
MSGTVLVTGGTGYIGGEVIERLLAKGHSVHTTVRNLAKSEPRLRARWQRAGERLSVFQADLMSDEGWAEANVGCDAVAHVASPFPLSVPKNKNDLIVPAREGTLRALKFAHAAGIARFVQTSSAAAIAYGHGARDPQALIEIARRSPDMSGWNLVDDVTTTEPYNWTEHSNKAWYAEHASNGESPLVVAYDYGIKSNILRMMTDRGIRVTVVPAQTPVDEVLAMQPSGVFLSNGPGDPAAVDYAIDNVKNLLGEVPIFGICLGHQILALALGGKTEIMKTIRLYNSIDIEDNELGLDFVLEYPNLDNLLMNYLTKPNYFHRDITQSILLHVSNHLRNCYKPYL